MPESVDGPPFSPTQIAYLVNADELGSALHEAAVHGDKKKLKKTLKSGISVDYPNIAGETALFHACYEGHHGIVETLLENGANPNERCDECSTPVHAAGYSCNPKVLSKIIEAGGDLRLHDSKGRTVKDWVLRQGDVKKKEKMRGYLEKIRTIAMTNSNKDLLERQPSSMPSMKKEKTMSIGNLFRLRSTHRSLVASPSVQSSGYGKIYFGEREHVGTMATIPLVCEGSLRHDDYGYTFNNGPFMVMESMLWNKVPVTVKRLHRDPPEGGNVDLLIQENEYMARLRHPNILLLMGVCQTNNMDGLILLYERIGCGSLYSYMNQKVETLDTLTLCEIMKQIADALLYLHQECLIHCNITSHAIQMVLPNFAKLCNFEYMIDFANAESGCIQSKILDNKYLNAAYNWMAPEVMSGNAASEKSDLYSLCAVLWEVFHGMPPWSGLHAGQIQTEVVENKTMLEINEMVKKPFSELLQNGLAIEPTSRLLTVEKFRNIMGQVLVDHNSMGIKGNSPHPPRSSKKYASSMMHSTSSNDEETLNTHKHNRSRAKQRNQSSTPMKTARSANSTKVDSDASDGSDNIDNELQKDMKERLLEEQRLPNSGYRKATSAFHKKDSGVQVTSIDIVDGDASRRPVSFPPERDSNNNSSSAFDKDAVRRAFFCDTWSKPNSTSTPTTGSPTVNSENYLGVFENNENGVFLTGDRGKQLTLESAQVYENAARPTSPQNPFKKEYEHFKSEKFIQTLTANLTAKPVVLNTRTATVVSSRPMQKIDQQSSKSSFRALTGHPLYKTSSTVYGALGGSCITKAIKPHGSLVGNYFINTDNQQDETDGPAVSPGPVYVGSRNSLYTLPGVRHSFAEGTRHVPNRFHSTLSHVGINNAIGSRSSWALVHDQHENPACFKPASHRSGSNVSPGKGSYPYSSKVNFAVPETYSESNDHCSASLHRETQRFITATIPQAKFAHTVDGNPRFRSESHLQTVQNIIPSHHEYQVTCQPSATAGESNTSPRSQKEQWYGGQGSIKDLISSFQSHTDEHFQKQAVLVKNSKRNIQDEEATEKDKDNMRDENTTERVVPGSCSVTERTESTIHVQERKKLHKEPRAKLSKKAVYKGKTIEIGPDGVKHMSRKCMSSDEVHPGSYKHQNNNNNAILSTCPSLQYKITAKISRRATDESETDQEVYEVVDEAVQSAHSEVMNKFIHPSCPHRPGSLADMRGLSLRNNNNNNNNNNCFSSDVRKAASCCSVNSKASSHLPATCSSSKSTGDCTSQSDSMRHLEDISTVSDAHNRKHTEVEEFYFDDILDSNLMKEKHMRLQTTIPLDDTPFYSSQSDQNKSSALDSWLSTSGDSQNISRRKARKEMMRQSQKDSFDVTDSAIWNGTDTHRSTQPHGTLNNEMRVTGNTCTSQQTTPPPDCWSSRHYQTPTKVITVVMDDEELLV